MRREAVPSQQPSQEPELRMARGLGQVLYGYLPGATFDFEEGRAICQVIAPFPDDLSVLPPNTTDNLLRRITTYIEEWRASGLTDRRFPSRDFASERIVVAEPRKVRFRLFPLTYHCQACNIVRVFRDSDEIARTGTPRRCPHCGNVTMRQLHQVLVHGCGRLEPVRPVLIQWDDERQQATQRRRWCAACQSSDYLGIDLRGERSRDFAWFCVRCGQRVPPAEVTMNCPDCLTRAHIDAAGGGSRPDATMYKMRLIPHTANSAFYAHTVRALDIFDPALYAEMQSPEGRRQVGAALVGSGGTGPVDEATAAVIANLTRTAEQDARNREQALKTIEMLVQLQSTQGAASTAGVDVPVSLAESAAEAQSLRTILPRQVLRVPPTAAGRGPSERIAALLGISEIALCESFPVIAATLGYSRRSFEPTYEEGSRKLRATLMAFDPVRVDTQDRYNDRTGKLPVFAARTQTQGLYVRLAPDRVLRWLSANGLGVSAEETESQPDAHAALLQRLEGPDRFFERLDDMPLTRLTFTLLHTVAHVALAIAASQMGLERTSLAEYLLLPDLSFVVYPQNTRFDLGGIRSIWEDHLEELLTDMASPDALRCLYDPQCSERMGACHGCLYLPEVSCTAFNRGLSRAVLQGGHDPWQDPGSGHTITGYWGTGL